MDKAYLHSNHEKTKKVKAIKPKKCVVCEFNFTPRSTTQKVCSPNCAIELNHIKKRQAYDKETKELKQAIKRKPEYVKEAQKAFNLYIRTRDKLEPCISCLRTDKEIKKTDGWKTGGAWDCGHFLSVGAFPEHRFNSYNAHRQCKSCNGGSDKYAKKTLLVATDYRINIAKKIGAQQLKKLEGYTPLQNYSVEDLIRIRKIYTLKARRLKNV